MILSERPPGPKVGTERPAVSRIDAYEAGINDVRMRVAAAEPSVLVLSQTHYPGWKAVVDGKDAPLLRADYGFLGVPLGPGIHTVRFLYRPGSLRTGAFLTAAALLTSVGACAFGRRRSVTQNAPG